MGVHDVIRTKLDARKLKKTQKEDAQKIQTLIIRAGYPDVKDFQAFSNALSHELEKRPLISSPLSVRTLLDSMISTNGMTDDKKLRVDPPE